MNEIRAYTIKELQDMREKLILNKKAKTLFSIAEINTEIDRRRDLYRDLGDRYAEQRYN